MVSNEWVVHQSNGSYTLEKNITRHGDSSNVSVFQLYSIDGHTVVFEQLDPAIELANKLNGRLIASETKSEQNQ